MALLNGLLPTCFRAYSRSSNIAQIETQTQDPILDHYEADLDLTYYPSNEFGLFEPEQQSFGHSNNPNTSLI